jgi:hypothetical protein
MDIVKFFKFFFFLFYVHPVDKNTGQYIRTEGKDKDSWQLAISSWQERREE